MLGWIPGVSVAVLVNVVAIPRHLAQLCVTPLRIFSFFCFTGIVASVCMCVCVCVCLCVFITDATHTLQ